MPNDLTDGEPSMPDDTEKERFEDAKRDMVRELRLLNQELNFAIAAGEWMFDPGRRLNFDIAYNQETYRCRLISMVHLSRLRNDHECSYGTHIHANQEQAIMKPELIANALRRIPLVSHKAIADHLIMGARDFFSQQLEMESRGDEIPLLMQNLDALHHQLLSASLSDI